MGSVQRHKPVLGRVQGLVEGSAVTVLKYLTIFDHGPLIFHLENCENHSVLSSSLRPRGLYSPWNSPVQNTGVGSLALLQGIFPTQGWNPGLPHGRRILYQRNRKRSPNYIPSNMQPSATCLCRDFAQLVILGLYPGPCDPRFTLSGRMRV